MEQELFARGANYLEESAEETARADRWLNQGYREIINLHAWPFLQASATSAPPVSIPDLRRILNVYVGSSNQPLKYVSIEDLRHEGLDLSTTGTPEYYYIGSGNSVHTYPVTTESITARYIKRVNPLSGTEEPIFDEEYHNLIVDKAMVKVYQDSDNFEAAAALQTSIDTALQSMGEDYMVLSRDMQFIEPTGFDS